MATRVSFTVIDSPLGKQIFELYSDGTIRYNKRLVCKHGKSYGEPIVTDKMKFPKVCRYWWAIFKQQYRE